VLASRVKAASPRETPPLPWIWDVLQTAWLLLPLLPGISAVGLAVTMFATWQRHWPQLRRDRYVWGFAALSLGLMLSASFAVRPGEAWLGLANLIPFFLLVLALRCLVRSPAQLRRLAWLSLAVAPLVAIGGLGQMLLDWTTPDFWYKLSGWRLVAGGNPPGRMASAFMYANLLAFYLAIVWTLGLGLALQLWHDWQQQRRGGRALLFSLAALALTAWGLALTQSRNAWLLAIAGSIAFAIYEGWFWLLLAIAAASSAIAWAAFAPQWGGRMLRRWLPELVWARLSGEMFPHRYLAELRTTQWQFAWQMARDRPWLGWGLRNFSPLYEAQWQFWVGHPHNLYLMLLAETGAPALLVLSGLVAGLVAPAVQNLPSLPPRDRRTLFSYLLAFAGTMGFNCLDVTLFDLRANAIAWLLLGAIAGVGAALTSPAAAVSSPALEQ